MPLPPSRGTEGAEWNEVWGGGSPCALPGRLGVLGERCEHFKGYRTLVLHLHDAFISFMSHLGGKAGFGGIPRPNVEPPPVTQIN